MRWNSASQVERNGKSGDEIGGHQRKMRICGNHSRRREEINGEMKVSKQGR